MKKFRIISLILCFAITLALFAGCSKGDTLKVGVIQYATHSSLDDCYDGLIAGLAEAGYKDGV